MAFPGLAKILIQTQNKEIGKKTAQTSQTPTPARKKEAFTKIHDVRHERREVGPALFLVRGVGFEPTKAYATGSLPQQGS